MEIKSVTKRKKLLSHFYSLTLRNKLIISFICLIIIPVSSLALFLIRYSSDTIQNTAIKSALKSNEQVIKNLDSFIEMLSKLSEFPITDEGVNKVILKDYTIAKSPEYERVEDFNTVNKFAYDKIKSFSDMIDSVVLYGADSNIVYGRTPTDFLNTSYVNGPFKEEKWLKRIVDMGGGRTVIGVHRDLLSTPRGDFVISVGRCILDPYSSKNLGVIIINTGVEKLETLWMNTKITPGSRLYLVDENNNIISSSNRGEVNQSIYEIMGKKVELKDESYILDKLTGQMSYIISSASVESGWKIVTIIPKNELLAPVNAMYSITIVSASLDVLLSLFIAILIATGITKPLHMLNRKMKQVGEGNLDIDIDIKGGEVGEIGSTVQKMLDEIKALIVRIYKEEEEKRNAEMLALQSQINPHFIFNTLNVVKWMAHIQGALAIEGAITSLSSLLSYTARAKGDFVPVKNEIDFIKDYLKILALRYYNKFTVTYDIDDVVENYRTLKFLLQPVIENAVFHGFDGLLRKGSLKISIKHEDSNLILRVEDDGNGIDTAKLSSIFDEKRQEPDNKLNSIGLYNVQKRIKLHFGDKYGLYIKSTVGEGTLAEIVVPAIGFEE